MFKILYAVIGVFFAIGAWYIYKKKLGRDPAIEALLSGVFWPMVIISSIYNIGKKGALTFVGWVSRNKK